MSSAAPAPAEYSGQARVKELAAAVSTQAQFANRAWLALITIAAFAVLPRTDASLPFGFGAVDPTWFHGTAFFILVVLAIAFASAHVQEGRADKLAQSTIDRLANDDPHPRDLFDILRQPSLNRLAPLALSLRLKYQFSSTKKGCPFWLRLSTGIYYGLLKLPSIAVYVGLPGWALWRSFSLLEVSGWIRVMLIFAGWVGGATLLQVFLFDLVHAVKILILLCCDSRSEE